MNEFKRASKEFKAQIEQEIFNLEVEKRQTILPPGPPPEGVASRTLNVASGEVVAPSALGSSDDEPLFASGGGVGSTDPSPVATKASSPSDTVTSPDSQESHV